MSDKYNLKTTVCLQLCYTPNNSSTTEEALFHVKSGKAVATYKLCPSPPPVQTLQSCYFLYIHVQLKMTTKLWVSTALLYSFGVSG